MCDFTPSALPLLLCTASSTRKSRWCAGRMSSHMACILPKHPLSGNACKHGQPLPESYNDRYSCLVRPIFGRLWILLMSSLFCYSPTTTVYCGVLVGLLPKEGYPLLTPPKRTSARRLIFFFLRVSSIDYYFEGDLNYAAHFQVLCFLYLVIVILHYCNHLRSPYCFRAALWGTCLC